MATGEGKPPEDWATTTWTTVTDSTGLPVDFTTTTGTITFDGNTIWTNAPQSTVIVGGSTGTETWVEDCDLCKTEFEVADPDADSPQTAFCPLCHAALLQLRKNYVAESLEKIGIAKEREEGVSFHQGFTKTGSLIHAVGLVKRGEYQPRAACGVRITEAKARKFEQAEKGSECRRCQESLAA